MIAQDKFQKKRERKQKRRLFSVITFRLTLVGVIGMIGFFLVLGILFYNNEKKEARDLTVMKVEDVTNDLFSSLIDVLYKALSDDSIIVELMERESVDRSVKLKEYLDEKGMTDSCEITIIDENGFIEASSNDELPGTDIHNEERYSELMPLLEGETDFIMTDLERTSKGLFAAKALSDGGGILLVEYKKDGVRRLLKNSLSGAVTYCTIGKSGYMMAIDSDGNILSSYREEFVGKNISEIGLSFDSLGGEYEIEHLKVFGEDSWVVASGTRAGITIVGVFPILETVNDAIKALLAFSVALVAIIVVVFVVIFIVIKRNVINSIERLDSEMEQITEGNLGMRMDEYSTREFKSLSDGINNMVDSLENYVREETERVEKELAVAREIQLSSMPPAGNAFSGETEFAIFATINTAKDVGGDFYDFYMLGDTLCFLIADVSGKGIPAAMFMMRAKTVIKSFAEMETDPDMIFTLANKKLCEENETGMFLTVWMGFLNIRTGLLKFVNAGHNPPLLIHGGEMEGTLTSSLEVALSRDGLPRSAIGGRAEYQKVKPGLLMGTLDMARYRENEIQLQPGDSLFLYTDGVTEAVNPDDEYYGEDRLQKVLSADIRDTGKDFCREVCKRVLLDVNGFSGDAEQADDITMLCLRYEGDFEKDNENTTENNTKRG